MCVHQRAPDKQQQVQFTSTGSAAVRALGGYDGRRQVGVYLDLCSAKIASECAEREEEAETQHLTRTRRPSDTAPDDAHLISKGLRPPHIAAAPALRRRRGLRLPVLDLRGP